MATLIIAITVVVGGGLMIQAIIHRQRRLRALRRLATDLRLRFSPEDVLDVQDRHQNLDLLRQGHSRHACHLLHGPTPVGPLSAFYYRYELGAGLHRDSRAWWIAVIDTRHALPHWQAVPEEMPPDSDGARVGRFHVRADHQATVAALRNGGAEPVLQDVADECHIEVRGSLVALAIPARPANADLKPLILCTQRLAQALVPPDEAND